jgi:hypothetical protein
MTRYVKSRNEIVSNRVKNAYEFEKDFARKCRRKKWVVQKGDLLAMYLLYPSRIVRKRVRWDQLKLIDNAINMAGLKKKFMKLINKPGIGYSKYENEDKVGAYGLPDFVILTLNSKMPLWVEVKFGSAIMRPRQMLMKILLEEIGFKVFLYRGGRMSKLEEQFG